VELRRGDDPGQLAPTTLSQRAPLGWCCREYRSGEGILEAVTPPSVLLYDGDCGFCAGSVQFVLRHEPHDRRARLRFAPLQGAFGESVRQGRESGAELQSVLWVRGSDQSVLARSDAALEALAHLGGAWSLLATVGRLVPRVLRDAVYDQVARRRFELAAPACLLPTPEQRARFLHLDVAPR
jgi:predicted DCC family thiol-disulfide oxidoreductase YuxK